MDVSYQLNIYTKYADSIPDVTSELHKFLQEVFAQNNIELVSPSFMVVRDKYESDHVIPDYGNNHKSS